MKGENYIRLFIYSCLMVCFSIGNYSCNREEGEDETHFCITQKPIGGEVWFNESVNNIMWHDNQAVYVRIELVKENQEIINIVKSTANTGIYRWKIPNDLEADMNYKVKVTSLSYETVSGSSLRDFTIKKPFPDSVMVDPRDGKFYRILKIGERWWMGENLNYITQTGSFDYKNDPGYAAVYGRLYFWEAAMCACPDGWEIPSDDDWKMLDLEMGVPENEIDNAGFRGKDVGYQMTNEGGSGFDALYSGYFRAYRVPNAFGHLHYDTRFWSSTRTIGEENHVWCRLLVSGYDGINRNSTWTTNANPVRCIKSESNY